MSTVGVSAGSGASQADWEAVAQESAHLIEHLALARKVRRLLTLGLVIFVAVTAWAFYGLYRQVYSPENLQELTQLAQKRVTDNSDRYAKEVQSLVEQATPVVTHAFYAQAKQDLPEFLRKAGEERDLLVTDLQERLTKRMDDHYRAVLERHEKILKEELPATDNPEIHERLRTNLGLVFDRMVQRYYGDEMKDQLVALYDAWDHFPAASQPTGSAEPPLEDQFIGTLLELLTQKLTQSEAGGAVASSATTVPAVAPASPRQRRDEEEGAIRPAEPEQPKSDDPTK